MYLDGAIYQGRKPIHWCSHCHTALAEAEIEYSDETSPSIYVKFYFTKMPQAFAAAAKEAGLENAKSSVVIWTTTPWTLPANKAVSLAPDADYVAVIVDGELYVMAQELVEQVTEIVGWDSYEILHLGGHDFTVKGRDLAKERYIHPILDGEEGILIYGDHVTLDTGTGAVHTAPGHGADDYLVAQEFGIETVMPVDDDGRFMKGTCPWEGKDAVESNPEIIEWLRERGTMLAAVKITHSYPHCWRCKEPVIFRATTQWFVSMDKTGLRDAAMNEINNNVQWVPAWASKRIGSMVQDRPDWCISRQRFWGVPIPVFSCKDCGEIIANEDTFDAVIELFKTQGADAWYTTPASEILPPDTCCPKCGSKNIEGEHDVLDVWWESGVSHTSVCEARPYLQRPADLYLEGSDQHRGWFQSSLLTSTAAYEKAPYKAVMSCGFTVDKDGKKMSKSIGNVIDPADVIAKVGADVLRLWVGSVDYSQDVSIGDEIIERTSEAYRRIRNTYRYLLSNLYDFSNDDYVAQSDLLEFDAWALARLVQVCEEVTKHYDEYHFHAAYRSWYDFIVMISSVYFDAIKDRLYSDAANSVQRRSAQTVLANMLQAMVRQLAPILTFTTDEVWEYFPDGMKSQNRPQFVQLAGWQSEDDFIPALPKDKRESLLQTYETVSAARDVVTKALEDARNEELINKSQEACVVLTAPSDKLSTLKERGVEALAEMFIISELELQTGDELKAEVKKATGEKCPRCWNYRQLGDDGLCPRCHAVVEAFEA